MKNALVIVHLSSLDSYTWQAGEDLGYELAATIGDAIREHPGPVYIIDQGWEYAGRQSKPRMEVLESVKRRSATLPPVSWIKYDEADPDDPDWPEFLAILTDRLRNDGVGKVEVGGIWYDPAFESGCATEVYLGLRKHFPTTVNRDLVGCESDIEE